MVALFAKTVAAFGEWGAWVCSLASFPPASRPHVLAGGWFVRGRGLCAVHVHHRAAWCCHHQRQQLQSFPPFAASWWAHHHINTLNPHHPLYTHPQIMKLSLALLLGLSLPVALLALPAQECPPEFGTSGWVNDLGLLADAVSMGGADFKDDSKGVCATYKVLKTCEARVRKAGYEAGGKEEGGSRLLMGLPGAVDLSSSTPPFLPYSIMLRTTVPDPHAHLPIQGRCRCGRRFVPPDPAEPRGKRGCRKGR